MRSKILAGLLLLTVVGGVSALEAVATRQTAVVRFMRPTIIAGVHALGAVVLEHDEARMARGEPCTYVYHYDAKNNARGDVLVAFHCVRQTRPRATQFDASLQRSSPTGPDRLLEYQFEGDTEGHGVPQ